MIGLKSKLLILTLASAVAGLPALAAEKYRADAKTQTDKAAQKTTVVVHLFETATGKPVADGKVRHLELITHERGTTGGATLHEHTLTPDGHGGYSYTFPYLFQGATVAKFRAYFPDDSSVLKVDVPIAPGG